MKVAAIQMVSATALAPNLDSARRLLEEAAGMGVEFAVLPEYFCIMGRRDTDKLAIQERFGAGPIQDFLATTAQRLQIWIAGGTLPLAIEGVKDEAAQDSEAAKVTNTSLVFAPDGRCVARYDKIHLFRFDNGTERFDEARVLLPGAQPVVFELPSRDGHTWRVGMSVCYDLRFPELYRAYARARADLLLVPSAFTQVTGQAHWEILLRARAIENQAFVAAAAQGGLHENGRTTWGHSLLADPWGRVLAQQAEHPGVVCSELVIGERQAAHAKLPALDHRVL
jgi:deaminated glutathione amidase